MAVRPGLLAIILISFPVIAFGQSYEWSDRLEGLSPAAADINWQVVPTEHGVYSVGYIDCDFECRGILSKFSAADGQLLWRRKLALARQSPVYSVTVNDLGVFVAGLYANPFSTSSFEGSFVRHYSHDGDIVWTVQDCCTDRGAFAIDSDADGLYVGGYTGSERAVLRHLSFAGELLWTRVLPLNTDRAESVVVGDGQVFVATVAPFVDVYRTTGNYLGRIPVDAASLGRILYHEGFLYTVQYYGVTKYSLDGDVIWKLFFSDHPTDFGMLDGHESAIAVYGDNLFVVAKITTGHLENAQALVRLDFNGSILDVTPYLGHQMRVHLTSLSALDGALYVAGSADRHGSLLTGRLSEKDLIRPAILTLQGAAPAQPPRLAVLHHDYGAGPVRVGIRDATPGSVEYTVGFDEDLTPVAYDRVADMNGNGYEELVVVSRLPAVAEIRDSLDGSLVSRIQLGEPFEPVAADVEERPGEAPRLAVVVRNDSTERLVVRIHDMASGTLLDSLMYNRNFDPVDVLALPAAVSNTGHRYAVLSRNLLAGLPHKIEIRGTAGALVENYWMNSVNEPIKLALTGTAANPVLAALMNRTDTHRPGVLQADLQSGSVSTLRYTDQFLPVAMSVLPDSDGNGYPQLTVLSDKTDGKVKTETRDTLTGALDGRINFNPNYHPRDVAYLEAVPGFSTRVLAVIGLPKAVNYTNNEAPIRAEIVDVDGSELFDLDFRFGL